MNIELTKSFVRDGRIEVDQLAVQIPYIGNSLNDAADIAMDEILDKNIEGNEELFLSVRNNSTEDPLFIRTKGFRTVSDLRKAIDYIIDQLKDFPRVRVAEIRNSFGKIGNIMGDVANNIDEKKYFKTLMIAAMKKLNEDDYLSIDDSTIVVEEWIGKFLLREFRINLCEIEPGVHTLEEYDQIEWILDPTAER